MIHAADGPTVIVSPHLDDAVLSTFHVLDSGQPVLLVDVFCGVPPEGTLSLWDRICGFTSSRDTAEARLHEEYAVLGRFPNVDGFLNPRLEGQYREAIGDVEPDVSEIVRDLVHAIERLADGRVSRILAPLCGSDRPNPDHLLARDAALALRWSGVPVELYADFPHVCKARGAWPLPLVLGLDDALDELDADPSIRTTDDPPRWINRLVREGIVDPLWQDKTIRILDDAERARKVETARLYATQFDSLDRKLRTKGIVSDPALHGVEVLVAPAATSRKSA